MRVAIRFTDNDFTTDIRTFFELYIIPNFIEREEGHMVTHLTTSMIVDMFNLYMPHVYRHNREIWAMLHKNISYTKWDIGDYLTITDSNVHWDSTIDEIILDNNGDITFTDGKTIN
jgi:hypothetical protein